MLLKIWIYLISEVHEVVSEFQSCGARWLSSVVNERNKYTHKEYELT